jgi:hypothetical protein
MTDELQYLPKSQLKARGWTDGGITRFLGACDKTARNPCYRSAAPMQLFLLDRVVAAETSDAYKTFTEQNRNRVKGAKKAVQTKKEQLMQTLRGWTIAVKSRPYPTAVQDAIDSYNKFHGDRCYDRGYDFMAATETSDPDFLRRITVNYLRHNLSSYDRRLDDLFGKVGKAEAYLVLNRKIYTSIAETYPDLAEECERQMYRKSGTYEEFEKPVIVLQRMF